MAPRALRLPMAWRRATSPSLSRLEFGSSSTTRNGSPYKARARATRWRCPPDSVRRLRRSGCRSRSATVGSSRARRRRWAARSTASASGSTLMRAMFSAMVPSNSSTSATGSRHAGRAGPDPTGRARRRRAARSLAGRQMPTRARTSEVLPTPLGPMMPSAWPVLSVKRTSATIGLVPPGARTTTCSTSRLRAGRGSAVTARFGAARVSASDSRVALARGDEAAPVGDRGLDGRQRAPHHDRGGNHGAGRHPAGSRDRRPARGWPTAARAAALSRRCRSRRRRR